MARGGPDYGASSARYTIFPVTDLGELAVRLGSPVAYDRQGNVIYTESFENGLAGWDTDTSGAGASVDVSFGRGVHGAWAGRLVAGSDAAPIDHVVSVDAAVAGSVSDWIVGVAVPGTGSTVNGGNMSTRWSSLRPLAKFWLYRNRTIGSAAVGMAVPMPLP